MAGLGQGRQASPVSCLSVYLFAASSAALGLPSSALDVSCFPREPIHVGTPERAAGSVPVTATVLPQLSTGPAGSPSASTVRLLEWTEAAAPPSGSGLRVSSCGDWRGPASRRCGAGPAGPEAGPEAEGGEAGREGGFWGRGLR